MNLDLVKDKYKAFVSKDKDKFIEELSLIKKHDKSFTNNDMPVLIYSKNHRNALYYFLCVKYSLEADRILDYAVTTGQTYIDQHFMNDDKDKSLYDSLRYSDISFISLSQFDYTNQYLENLLIELVEFRKAQGRITIISFDIIDSFTYEKTTAKLYNYFVSNNYPIINMTDRTFKKEAFANVHSETKDIDNGSKQNEEVKTPKKGRIK